MFEQDKFEKPEMGDDCRAFIEKFLSICLPVKIIPCVEVKKIKVDCCGNALVVPHHHENCCNFNKNGDCEFTIVQKMKVEIPVEFSTQTIIEDPFVDCEFQKDWDKDDKKDKHDKDYYGKDKEHDKEHEEDCYCKDGEHDKERVREL